MIAHLVCISINMLQVAQQKKKSEAVVIGSGRFDTRTSDTEREEMLKSILGSNLSSVESCTEVLPAFVLHYSKKSL